MHLIEVAESIYHVVFHEDCLIMLDKTGLDSSEERLALLFIS